HPGDGPYPARLGPADEAGADRQGLCGAAARGRPPRLRHDDRRRAPGKRRRAADEPQHADRDGGRVRLYRRRLPRLAARGGLRRDARRAAGRAAFAGDRHQAVVTKPVPAKAKRGAARKPRGPSPARRRWERLIAETLVVALCGIAVVFGVRAGVHGIGALFSSSDSTVASERLLLPVEQQGMRFWRAPGLPQIAAMPADVRRAIHPAARAEGTTALGLYQFTTDTWLRVVKVFGARHGLGAEARQITVARDGGVA